MRRGQGHGCRGKIQRVELLLRLLHRPRALGCRIVSLPHSGDIGFIIARQEHDKMFGHMHLGRRGGAIAAPLVQIRLSVYPPRVEGLDEQRAVMGDVGCPFQLDEPLRSGFVSAESVKPYLSG